MSRGAFTQSETVDSYNQSNWNSLLQLTTEWQKEVYRESDVAQCLPKILDAINWQGEVRQILDSLPYNCQEYSLPDLLNTLVALGYKTHQTKANSSQIDDRLLPCLFISTEEQIRVLSHQNDTDTRQGMAFFFEKITNDTDITDDHSYRSRGMPWFYRLIKRYKGVFWQVTTTGIMLNLLALITPLFMMMVYDRVIGAHSPQTLHYLVVGVVLALCGEFILRYMRSRALEWFGTRVDNIVSNSIFEKLLYLAPSYTETASVSSQLSRIKAFESVRDFFVGPMFTMLLELPFIIILMIAIGIIGGWLVLIPISVIILYSFLLFFLGSALKGKIQFAAQARSKRQEMGIETLSKIPTIRSSGIMDIWLARYNQLSGEAGIANYRVSFLVSIIEALSQSIATLAGVFTVFFGVELIWSGNLSTGGLIAIMILTWRTTAPIQSICTMLPRLEQLKSSINQINKLMDLSPERNPIVPPDSVPAINGHLEFQKVGLRYSSNSNPVFAGLSFIANPGELIAIVGGNGTGKSTILRMINAYYSPQAGSILIDGLDIRQLPATELRRHIAYFPQDAEVFSGTIAENLRLVCPDASEDKIWLSLRKTGLEETIKNLPEGLDTQLSAEIRNELSDSGLSCLCLARAYLMDTTIMLFDELPFSVLNGPAGKYYKEFLKESKGKKTVIMITHRNDFIDLADKLITLYADGRPQVKEINLSAKEG